MKISLSELEDGMMFNSPEFKMCAYVNTETGAFYFQAEGAEEEPDDLASNPAWVKIPGKYDLDLGKSLYHAFSKEHCPDQYDTLHQRLNRKGGYRALRDYFEEHDLLDRFYEFEDTMIKQALREWAEDEGLEVR